MWPALDFSLLSGNPVFLFLLFSRAAPQRPNLNKMAR
jgi:hypothetical protein